MKNIDIERRIYIEPSIERIVLDAEISLALESNPPAPETLNRFHAPEYFNNDPFQGNTT